MRYRTVCAGVLLAAFLLPGSPASAQDKALETAKQYFDDGQNMYLLAKYTEAAEQFMKAYEAKPFPAFLFNGAVCHEKNRDFAKALSLYERYLAEDPHTPDRELVLKRVAAIREHLSPPSAASATQPASQPAALPPALPPVNPKGLVIIESNPAGAAIYLGDKRRGIFTRTPYTGNLPAGQHTVIVEMKKYKPETKTISVRSDRMAYLYFGLSAEEYLGWIEVRANVPGADVYFDSKDVGALGRTPYTGFLRPGKRRIIVERAGYEPYVQETEISAGKEHVVNVKLDQVRYGWLKVTGQTTQGATLKANGKVLDCRPPCQVQLPEGNYAVEVERKDQKTYREQVTITRAVETQLAVRLNPKPSRVKAYVTFGVATAFLVGGIVTGVMSKNRADELQSDLDGGRVFDSSDSRITSGKVTAIVADSLFGLTAITAGLGVYYLFRNEGPDSYGETRANKLTVAPILGPSAAGISGQVRF